MEQIDTLVSVAKSKQTKDLMKCAQKNCDKYVIILEKEKAVIDKMKELKNSLSNPKDTEGIVAKSMNLVKLTKELTKLGTDKDALICGFTKCGKEFADLFAFKNKKMVTVIEKQEKMLEKFVKRHQKQLKNEEKVEKA